MCSSSTFESGTTGRERARVGSSTPFESASPHTERNTRENASTTSQHEMMEIEMMVTGSKRTVGSHRTKGTGGWKWNSIRKMCRSETSVPSPRPSAGLVGEGRLWLSVVPYELTVTTGDMRGAGTDAGVSVQIYGVRGRTQPFALRNNSDNFERGATDVFKVTSLLPSPCSQREKAQHKMERNGD